ncbi:hypothetical protein [Streptomyces sp. BRA346]
MRKLRLHDLRHTCITLLLDLGVPAHVALVSAVGVTGNEEAPGE